MNRMTMDEARKFLAGCARGESRDHAFGDREIYWSLDGKEVAGGYVGNGEANVWIDEQPGLNGPGGFEGREALELCKIGKTVTVERNDSTGPDRYADNVCMPGLTLAGVRKELVG